MIPLHAIQQADLLEDTQNFPIYVCYPTNVEVEMITQETNPVIISLYFTLEPWTVIFFILTSSPQNR